MIVVTASSNRITATGHARYAQQGKDIVCAAVSALTLSLVHALHDLTPGLACSAEDDGNVEINIMHPTNKTDLLVAAYVIGIRDVAESFPAHVKLVEAMTTVKQGDAWSSE